MKTTIPSTRKTRWTGEGRVLIRGPVDRLIEQARAWDPATDSGLTADQRNDEAATAVDANSDDALGADDMCGLLDRLARREVSPHELWEAAMARAEPANQQLNAVCTWVGQDSAGRPDGPLAGIPTAIKDYENLAGYPTSYGSWAVADQPAQANSPFVEQFLHLGLAPIAKTTLPEFGASACTESLRFGDTRNPWNTSRTPGGSSGGSAALVAAGVVPLAHAMDGGGSTRIPAAACGLVGLKPSRGRLIDHPAAARMPIVYATHGVLTRTVRDTARYLAEAERLYANPNLPPVGLVTDPNRQRLHIGAADTGIGGIPVADVSRQAVNNTARLCEDLGHHVEHVQPMIDNRFGADVLRYMFLLTFVTLRAGSRMLGAEFHADRTGPLVRGMSALAIPSLPQIPTSIRRLRRLAAQGEEVFEHCDVLIVPSTGHETPPIGHLAPDLDALEHMVRLIRFVGGNPVQNTSGAPAVSLPLARTANGLPVGVQLIAPRGQERRLLELALELEAATQWPHRPTTA